MSIDNQKPAERYIGVRVTEDIKKAISDKAQKDGKTVSEVLMSFIRQYLDLSPSPDNTTERLERLEIEVAKVHTLQQEIEEIKRDCLGESAA